GTEEAILDAGSRRIKEGPGERRESQDAKGARRDPLRRCPGFPRRLQSASRPEDSSALDDGGTGGERVEVNGVTEEGGVHLGRGSTRVDAPFPDTLAALGGLRSSRASPRRGCGCARPVKRRRRAS